MPGPHRGEKRALSPPELELQRIMSCYVGDGRIVSHCVGAGTQRTQGEQLSYLFSQLCVFPSGYFIKLCGRHLYDNQHNI